MSGNRVGAWGGVEGREQLPKDHRGTLQGNGNIMDLDRGMGSTKIQLWECVKLYRSSGCCGIQLATELGFVSSSWCRAAEILGIPWVIRVCSVICHEPLWIPADLRCGRWELVARKTNHVLRRLDLSAHLTQMSGEGRWAGEWVQSPRARDLCLRDSCLT